MVNRHDFESGSEYDQEGLNAKVAELEKDGWEIIDIIWNTPNHCWILATKWD